MYVLNISHLMLYLVLRIKAYTCIRFVMDVKWFKQWKRYVGFESRDHYNVGEESSHPGQIDNTPIFQGNVKYIF